MKLLLIEDNQILAEDIVAYLQENNFMVEYVGQFELAKEKIALYTYDLVILDLGLPDGNGLDLIPYIKEYQPEIFILILTANDALEYKVKGLDEGADDYLTKPFHKAELNARIRSLLRRKLAAGGDEIIHGDLKIDLRGREVTANGKILRLTKKEYDLLLFMAYNTNRLLTKESIAEYLWGDHIDQADNFDFIYNHIKNLRRKIKQSGAKDPIQSMYGMGYKFITD